MVNEIKPIKLEEQEVEDTHIFRRSVVPLIMRLVLINIIWFFIYLAFNLLMHELSGSFDFYRAMILNIIFLLLLMMTFGGLFLYVALSWLGEVYIVKLPTVTIRSGFINVREKKFEVMPASEVEVRQSPVGKFFNYGTVIFESMTIYDVPEPHHIANIFKAKPLE